MSRSSLLASSLDAEIRILNPINNAMINMKLAKLGRASELDLDHDNILKSRKDLADFIHELLEWLKREGGNPAYYFIYEILLTGRKSSEDWKKMLIELEKILKSDSAVTDQELELLERLLSQIDSQISSKIAQLNNLRLQ